MKIPSSLKIGALTFKVVFKSLDGCGQIDWERMEITLNPRHSREAQEATLFHEILHGINNEIDHALLDSLAAQLYAVFKENHMLR